MFERQELPSSVRHGPLASVGTIYELPNGRRCVVTFANRGADFLTPIRNDRGELWIGHLLRGDVEPTRFDDWERDWVSPELLRPVGELFRPDPGGPPRHSHGDAPGPGEHPEPPVHRSPGECRVRVAPDRGDVA